MDPILGLTAMSDVALQNGGLFFGYFILSEMCPQELKVHIDFSNRNAKNLHCRKGKLE